MRHPTVSKLTNEKAIKTKTAVMYNSDLESKNLNLGTTNKT